MNVYDFDKTIYSGDSSVDFYLFCLKNSPLLTKYIPFQLFWFTVYLLGLCDKTKFKQKFFSFIKNIDTNLITEKFWDENIGKIKPWYLGQKNKTDVIISASPEFLVSICMKRLCVTNYICTLVSEDNGMFLSANCYGIEKLNRFVELYDTHNIENFYSDSVSDTPLAQNAKKAYVVKGDCLIPWTEYTPKGTEKIKSVFLR